MFDGTGGGSTEARKLLLKAYTYCDLYAVKILVALR